MTDVTVERLKELLDYDPATGLFTRKVAVSRMKAGTIAGMKHKGHGYVVIKIDNKSYLAHRLAWLYTYGEWPSGEVMDHKNLIRHDNRLENIRVATASQNAHNKSVTRACKAGFKGVSYRARWPYRPWIANISVGSKVIYLGAYATALEANEAYRQAAIRYFGEFARYTVSTQRVAAPARRVTLDAEIMEMHDATRHQARPMTKKEIAVALGTTWQTVQGVLKRRRELARKQGRVSEIEAKPCHPSPVTEK